jgi:signal transduction histidine kinase
MVDSRLAQEPFLVELLGTTRGPVTLSGLKRVLQTHSGEEGRRFQELINELERHALDTVVPSFIGRELMGFVVLGPRVSGEPYTRDDLNTLTILANQVALSLANIQLLEQELEAERRLAEQKRLVEFGELMGAINHEYNNVLGSVSASLHMMAIKFQDPPLLQQVQDANTDIMRGRFITQAASKYRKLHATPVQFWALRPALEEALETVQQEPFAGAAPQVTVTTECPEGLSVEGRGTIPELIKDCLRCLGWTCDHQPGRLRIVGSDEADMVQLAFIMQGGADLRVEIEKTGGALAPEPGRHGGLYYFLVRRIVTDHHGTISVQSTPGGGTTLIIRLPRTQPPAGAAEQGKA